jgi:uncharacterized protein DUF2569
LFCARCGQQIPDATEICPLCGREASIHLNPPPAAPAPMAAPAPAQIKWPNEAETTMPPARQPRLRGVGGWLLVFCILLTVVAPLAVFVSAWRGGFEADDIVNIAWAAFGFVVGMMVWNVHRHAFVLLWIYFGLTVLIFALAIISLALADEAAEPRDSILLFRSLIYTVAWFVYFKKSDRVQATFGRNL